MIEDVRRKGDWRRLSGGLAPPATPEETKGIFNAGY